MIGPRGPLFGSSQMTTLYAAAPVYRPDEFGLCDTGSVTIVMTWLIPITDAEASYVGTRGWRAFEEALMAEDPDLADPSRRPVSAAAGSGR